MAICQMRNKSFDFDDLVAFKFTQKNAQNFLRPHVFFLLLTTICCYSSLRHSLFFRYSEKNLEPDDVYLCAVFFERKRWNSSVMHEKAPPAMRLNFLYTFLLHKNISSTTSERECGSVEQQFRCFECVDNWIRLKWLQSTHFFPSIN